LEQVAFSDSSGADVMDGKRVLITTTAAWQVIVGRLQSDEQRLSVNLGIRFYRESFPEQGKRISIHRDGGESVRFVVLANSKLTGFTAVSYCFTLTRDEPYLYTYIIGVNCAWSPFPWVNPCPAWAAFFFTF